MEILHAYDTVSGIYSGANPKTYIRRKGETSNYATFSGSAIKLAMKDLLHIAGVDLDKPYDDQPNAYNPPVGLQGVGTSVGKYPYPRLSGRVPSMSPIVAPSVSAETLHFPKSSTLNLNPKIPNV